MPYSLVCHNGDTGDTYQPASTASMNQQNGLGYIYIGVSFMAHVVSTANRATCKFENAHGGNLVIKTRIGSCHSPFFNCYSCDRWTTLWLYSFWNYFWFAVCDFWVAWLIGKGLPGRFRWILWEDLFRVAVGVAFDVLKMLEAWIALGQDQADDVLL